MEEVSGRGADVRSDGSQHILMESLDGSCRGGGNGLSALERDDDPHAGALVPTQL